MTSLLMKEIHNLQEVIDDCLDDIPIDDPKVETLKDKYYQSLGMLQKSLHYRIRSNVLSCGIYRTEEGNPLVRVTMMTGKTYDFPGKEWHCKMFAKEFRRRILNVYI